MRNANHRTKVLTAVVLTIAVVVALVVAGVTVGFNNPAVPSGDVAIVDGVDDGGVSEDDFDQAMQEGAKTLGLPKVPAQDDQSYTQLVGQAMQQLLLPIWVRGEAEERGLTVSDDDVKDEYESQKKQAGIKTQKQLDKILEQRGLTEQEVIDSIRSQLLQDKLLAEAAPGAQTLPDDLAQLTPDEQVARLAEHYGITGQDIEAYYDTAKDKPVAEGGFLTPPSREARVILNTSKQKIEAAKAELEKGDLSDEAWQKAASKYSQDQTSSGNGGALPAPVEQGSATPSPYEQEVFDAPEGELVGPIDTGDRGYLLVEVTKATPEEVQPLDDKLRKQIQALIINNRQQQVFADFQADFFEKWTERTYCKPEADSEFCSGYQPEEVAPTPGQAEPPAVQAPQPIEPGTAEIPLSFPNGYQPTQGDKPQGPGAGVQLPPVEATGLPPGATTIPGGAVPPTGTTAPPTGTP